MTEGAEAKSLLVRDKSSPGKNFPVLIQGSQENMDLQLDLHGFTAGQGVCFFQEKIPEFWQGLREENMDWGSGPGLQIWGIWGCQILGMGKVQME